MTTNRLAQAGAHPSANLHHTQVAPLAHRVSGGVACPHFYGPSVIQGQVMVATDRETLDRQFAEWVRQLQRQGYKLALVKDGQVQAVQVLS